MKINQIGVITFKNGKIDSKSSFEINRILHSSGKRSMKMSKTIRVQWEYPDFANQLGDENYEDFEVDDDATPEEIQNEAEDIAFEHFSWSFWDVTKEHE